MPKLAASLIFYLAIFVSASNSGLAQARPGHVDDFKKDVEAAHSISMYFYTSTDLLVRNDNGGSRDATAVLTVKCDFACAHVMRRIVHNFANSVKLSNCPQEDPLLVIKLDTVEALSYFHGGEISEYHGRCYYNKKSINDFLHVLDFF
jgi:hypothetical protein